MRRVSGALDSPTVAGALLREYEASRALSAYGRLGCQAFVLLHYTRHFNLLLAHHHHAARWVAVSLGLTGGSLFLRLIRRL
jgi:hypothetical protein